MDLRIRLSLTDDSGRPFMGIGLIWLLQRIRDRGSIHAASREMGMSYVKALRILNRLEKKLGRPLLVRSMGGSARGGAVLTPFGVKFIAAFERLHERVDRCARREYAKLGTCIVKTRSSKGTRGKR
ncbi:MAG: LysR family transcriptional regulator [Chlamydiota bacterium]